MLNQQAAIYNPAKAQPSCPPPATRTVSRRLSRTSLLVGDHEIAVGTIRTVSISEDTTEKMSTPEKMDVVEQLIHDLEEGEWRSALRGLAIHGDERAVWPIIEFYGQLLDPNSRQVVLTREALLYIGEKAIDPLIRSLDFWNPTLPELACEILGELKAKQAVQPLGEVMMGDVNSLVAWTAAQAIGDIGGEESVDWLIKALKHPHRDIQQISVKALGELGNTKAIQPLIDYLNARDQELIDAVNNSLKQLGHT